MTNKAYILLERLNMRQTGSVYIYVLNEQDFGDRNEFFAGGF